MTITQRITDFYSRNNNGYTRAELSRALPDIAVESLGCAMQRLLRRGYLEREPVKNSRYQAMKYYRVGAKASRYTFVKPAESLIN